MEREKSWAMKTPQVPEKKQPLVEKFDGWAMSSFDLAKGLDVVEGISLDDWETETARERRSVGPAPEGTH